jgi:hypothetical protein
MPCGSFSPSLRPIAVPAHANHPDSLTLDRVLRFLQYLEDTRHNHRRTRNHRLTNLHTFFEFLGRRVPECSAVAQQVAAIPPNVSRRLKPAS